MNLWNLLDRAATTWPERPAAIDHHGVRTWRDVHAIALGIAGTLLDAGLRPGERVAILSHNRLEYLCAYFAAARLGAALVPLNTRWTASEIDGVLTDCEPRLLLLEPCFAATAAALTTPVTTTWIDSVPRGADGRDAPPAGDIAQLYYTSGTTGAPKGVILTHANVLAHATSTIAELQLREDDVWAHIAPMFHLADAWATFAVTACGGCHVFLDEFDAQRALDLLAEHRVTTTNLVPTMLNRMVERASADTRTFSALRLLLSGGAPIAPNVVRRVCERFGCEYVQTYGMTETSPFLTMSILRSDERALPLEQRIARMARTGRPVLGIELRVVDETGTTVTADDSAIGEVQVRGPSVTCGYWNDDVATERAFTDDGFLHTGDLATIDVHGSIRIVDRLKDVILTGGETVYSTEVEHRLYEHPAVLEAAVFGTADPDWGERVTAAIVLRGGESATGDELTRFCRATLAGYKTPKCVRFVDVLPRTGSGKIKKAALRDA